MVQNLMSEAAGNILVERSGNANLLWEDKSSNGCLYLHVGERK